MEMWYEKLTIYIQGSGSLSIYLYISLDYFFGITISFQFQIIHYKIVTELNEANINFRIF